MDYSDPFIEGQKVSAMARGMTYSLHEAHQRAALDFDYGLDLHCLMPLLTEAEAPVRAVLFGSITEGNEGL